MKRLILWLILLLGIENQIYARQYETFEDKTNSPIIGVLAQEIAWSLDAHWPGVYESYIAASYVKFIEGGGARVVPVWIGKPRPYYEDILSKLNGVLFPGGGTWFNQTNGYAVAGAHIYDIATQMNGKGQYFPLFGTCLGFELLLFISNNNQEYRAKCSSQRQALPLNFTKDFENSRLFGYASEEVIDILQSEAVTANFHSLCATKRNLTDFGLDQQWKVLSYNEDRDGLEFISSIEHKRYPFYGVQFHPEKSLYEWIRNRNIPHSGNAIRSAQYFASFFVNECRKSDNRFASVDEENQVLIYNFPTKFTGRLNSTFEQSYLFEGNIDYPNYHYEKSNIDVVLIDNF